MIQTFRNKALERLLREGNAKGIPKELEKRIRVRLEVIDSTTDIDNLRIPGYNLHQLKATLRTISSGDDAVITKGWVVGMGFNQGWLQVQGCNKSVEEMLVERPSLHRCH